MKGIILDRDGTLIDVVRDEETGVIATAFHPSQIRFLDGVFDGLELLNRAGYVLAIATNQPGPAKGECSRDAITRTNDALVERLAARGIPIATVEVCFHHERGGEGGDPSLVKSCDCRKPKPGLLLRAAEAMRVSPAACWMLGDRPSDLEAGRAAAMRTGLVFSAGRCDLCPLKTACAVRADVYGATLLELARQIVA